MLFAGLFSAKNLVGIALMLGLRFFCICLILLIIFIYFLLCYYPGLLICYLDMTMLSVVLLSNGLVMMQELPLLILLQIGMDV